MTTHKIDIKHRAAKPAFPGYHEWKMWRGVCTCGEDWQFHFFGATLGYGLEHIRRAIAADSTAEPISLLYYGNQHVAYDPITVDNIATATDWVGPELIRQLSDKEM